MNKLSSRQNNIIRRYRALFRDKTFRAEEGVFPVEGAKLVEEALKSGLKPVGEALFTAEAAQKNPALAARLSGIMPVYEINEDLSAYIADTKSPQGIFACVKMLDNGENYAKIYKGRRLVILDRLQDVGNIGTIIRTCDAFGIDGIVLSEDCADVYSPKLVRSAMGSLYRVPIVSARLAEELPKLMASGFELYAAMLDENALPLDKAVFGEKSAVIIGNEGSGISEEIVSLCDKKIYIPISGAESLNAAVAAAVLCWEMR